MISPVFPVPLLEQTCLAAQRRDWLALNQSLPQLLSGVAAQDERVDVAVELQSLLTLLLDILETGEFADRWEVAKLLPLFGESVIPALIEMLHDAEADWELRWFVARILAGFDRPDVIEALAMLLETSSLSTDEELHSVAAAGLAQLGSVAIGTLERLLEQPNSRAQAVQALAQMRQPATIAPLLSVMQDGDAQIRATALEALCSFHDPRVLPVLLAALQDPDSRVRREAVVGLSLRPHLADDPIWLHQLCERLQDADLAVCQQAALSLSRWKSHAAVEALFQVLIQPTTPLPVQLEIIRALAWIATPFSLEYLQQYLIAANLAARPLEVCLEVVAVLGRTERAELKPRAVSVLLDLLRSNYWMVQSPQARQAIVTGLGQLGDPVALESLIALLADPDPGVCLHAIAALRQIDAQTAHQQLEALARSPAINAQLKQGILFALQEWQATEGSV